MRQWLLQLLKVAPEPTLPPGSQESVRVFRAAENFYRVLLLNWGFKQVSAIVGIVMSLTFLRNISSDWSSTVRYWVQALEWMGVAFYILQLPFSFAMVRLNFELRWYVVTDRSLRIRSGVLRVREMTMTFANIQHIAVHQGPLQRWLGLYNLKVRTAGGGGSGGDGHDDSQNNSVTHIGHFHGVDNAPAIRDLIIERMKQARDAGLGDLDDSTEGSGEAAESDTDMGAFRTALAEVHAETTSLAARLRTPACRLGDDLAPSDRAGQSSADVPPAPKL